MSSLSLTGVNVSNQTGWLFQSILILWSVFNYTVFIVYWTRFRLITNKSPLEKVYFYYITVNVIGESLRVIDPFSLHNIYPFYVNRIFNIFCGTLCSVCFGIIISDTLHAVLHRVNKEVRPSYFRYCTLIALFVDALPALAAIFILCLAANDIVDDTVADTTLEISFICGICGLSMILILIAFDIVVLKLKSVDPVPMTELEVLTDESDSYDEETQHRKEIVVHAKDRLIKGLYYQFMFVCFVIIGFILELIDGSNAIKEYYFGAGLLWGIALRLLPLILLYTQWIESEKLPQPQSDDDELPLAPRQTTVGFLRNAGHGVDLKRVHTLKRLISFD